MSDQQARLSDAVKGLIDHWIDIAFSACEAWKNAATQAGTGTTKSGFAPPYPDKFVIEPSTRCAPAYIGRFGAVRVGVVPPASLTTAPVTPGGAKHIPIHGEPLLNTLPTGLLNLRDPGDVAVQIMNAVGREIGLYFGRVAGALNIPYVIYLDPLRKDAAPPGP